MHTAAMSLSETLSQREGVSSPKVLPLSFYNKIVIMLEVLRESRMLCMPGKSFNNELHSRSCNYKLYDLKELSGLVLF